MCRWVVGWEVGGRGRSRLRGDGRCATSNTAARRLGRCAERGHALQASQAGDAIGSLSLEARGGGLVLVSAIERALGEMPTVAVLYSSRRKSAE